MPHPTTIAELRSIGRLRDRLERLASTIVDERCRAVLWVGAGLSRRFGNLPTWNSFLHQVADEALAGSDATRQAIKHLIDSGKQSLAAEYLGDVLGRAFTDHLVATFSESSGELPACMVKWGIRDVLTTNYDLLLEHRLTGYKVILPSVGMRGLLSSSSKIVKLHGTVDDPNSCVASISSYVKNYDNNLEWYIAQLFSTRPVVFLGSSMSQSEPFFKIIRILMDGRISENKHLCVLSVPNAPTATKWGRSLSEYGIDLIPYIPDADHSFILQLFDYIEEFRSSPQGISNVVSNVPDYIRAHRYFDAAKTLRNVLSGKTVPASQKKLIADQLTAFFAEPFAETAAKAQSEAMRVLGHEAIELIKGFLELVGDLSFLSGKGLRNVRMVIETVRGHHNNWGIKVPNDVIERFNTLVELWERSNKRHPKEVISKLKF
ncbi:SIR2 family protein [Bradyrhizobium diazoefficiens]